MGLAGCAKPGPTESPRTPSVRPGDYAILLSNFAAGDDPRTRDGIVLLVSPEGTVRGSIRFRPIDNARLATHNGSIAWMANDAAHHWGAKHKVWSEIDFTGGAVDNLIPAGDRFLAVINMGSSDGVGYESGLLLFDGTDIASWSHPGHLTSGVGTNGSEVLGFSAPGLWDREVRLTILTRGAESETLGQGIDSDFVWGEHMVQSHGRTCVLTATATTGQAGQIWRIDPGTREVEVVSLKGEAGLVDDWYQGTGPSQLTSIKDQLYWLAGNSLWTADPLTGESGQVMKAEGGSWYLTGSGPIHAAYEQDQLTLQRHDPTDGERLEVVGPFAVDGPNGLHVEGALVAGD